MNMEHNDDNLENVDFTPFQVLHENFDETQPIESAWELFKEYYNTGYGSIVEEDNLIQIHTGGWSDNEYLISELKKTWWWMGKTGKIECSGGHFYIDTDWLNDEKKHWVINKE